MYIPMLSHDECHTHVVSWWMCDFSFRVAQTIAYFPPVFGVLDFMIRTIIYRQCSRKSTVLEQAYSGNVAHWEGIFQKFCLAVSTTHHSFMWCTFSAIEQEDIHQSLESYIRGSKLSNVAKSASKFLRISNPNLTSILDVNIEVRGSGDQQIEGWNKAIIA